MSLHARWSGEVLMDVLAVEGLLISMDLSLKLSQIIDVLVLDEDGVSGPEAGVHLKLSQHPRDVAHQIVCNSPYADTSSFGSSHEELAVGAERER